MHISTAADHEVQCDLINPFSNVCTAEAAVKLTDGSRLISVVRKSGPDRPLAPRPVTRFGAPGRRPRRPNRSLDSGARIEPS